MTRKTTHVSWLEENTFFFFFAYWKRCSKFIVRLRKRNRCSVTGYTLKALVVEGWRQNIQIWVKAMWTQECYGENSASKWNTQQFSLCRFVYLAYFCQYLEKPRLWETTDCPQSWLHLNGCVVWRRRCCCWYVNYPTLHNLCLGCSCWISHESVARSFMLNIPCLINRKQLFWVLLLLYKLKPLSLPLGILSWKEYCIYG